MAWSSSCPSASLLQQLLAGPATAAEQDALLDHLGQCSACQGLLDQMAGANPDLLRAASTLHCPSYAEEGALRRVLEDFRDDSGLLTHIHSDRQTAWTPSLQGTSAILESLGSFENYEVEDLLGRGAMSVVLKAYEPALKRWVAIKVLAPELAGDRRARERFAREAQAAASVRHPHVVTIHAVRERNELPFIVMEYLAGGSLQDYLDSYGPLDWQTVVRVGAEIAEGLAAAHTRGLVHRDIKPSNILLPNEAAPGDVGPVKIGDFGLARATDEARLTLAGTILGTPMYMSPEQAMCHPLDERADLFSLGSVLYALCSGQEPFAPGSPMAVLRQVCEATSHPIHDLKPETPAWLVAVIERMQAKKPAERFSSAAEVAELLRYNLTHADQARTVPVPGMGRRTGPGKSRRRLIALAGTLFLLMGLLLIAPAPWARRSAGPEDQEALLPLRATLRGHQGPIWSVAFSPDGHTLATGSDDTTLRFWDTATGEQRAELSGHGSAVYAVAFAHSGQFLLSSSGDGLIRRWDVATHKEQSALPFHSGNVRRLAISPDDTIAAMGSNTQGVELWELGTRKLRQALPGHQGTIFALAFASDGQTLATGDTTGHIRFWDPATGAERSSALGDPLSLRALAFAPDSQTLASAGTGEKDVKLWRVATHEQMGTLPGGGNGLQNLAFAPNGELLAGCTRNGAVEIWDVRSSRIVATLPAHQGAVWSLTFSPDGQTLATVGEDRLGKLWDVRNVRGAQP
jgi:tRNA A-37 threonylcarbamoyl transferase component Bud32